MIDTDESGIDMVIEGVDGATEALRHFLRIARLAADTLRRERQEHSNFGAITVESLVIVLPFATDIFSHNCDILEPVTVALQ